MYNIEKNAFLFNASENLCQSHILQRLVDNGQAAENNGIISIPFFNIYELDEIEMEMVGLPPLYPFEILIEPQGNMASPEFKYKVLYESFAPAGEILQLVKKDGPCITVSVKEQNIDYLLRNEQYSLLDLIEKFNESPSSEKSKIFNNREFAPIKELSKKASAVLDRTLSDKEVVLPPNVKIIIEKNNDQVSLKPSIDGVDETGFCKSFDKQDEILESYPVFQTRIFTVNATDIG